MTALAYLAICSVATLWFWLYEPSVSQNMRNAKEAAAGILVSIGCSGLPAVLIVWAIRTIFA